VHATVVVARCETLQWMSRIMIVKELVSLRILLLMHHHLYNLLFIKRLLSLLTLLVVLEVFKLVIICVILQHFTHTVGYGKLLLLLFYPVSVVVF
jgi:hypothetical protein